MNTQNKGVYGLGDVYKRQTIPIKFVRNNLGNIWQ